MTEALTKPGPSGLAPRPDFIPESSQGLEHITKDDIVLPRLALAQGLSPQVQAVDPAFIKGLSVGQMFNDLTNEIYGVGPLEFHVVHAAPPRWVEFNPREEGGGVKDFEVPFGDPRTQFTSADDGTRVKPVATQFYDFVIVLWPSREMLALSFKSSGLKQGKKLNFLMSQRRTARSAGRYTICSMSETNAKGTFAVYRVDNSTSGSRPGWAETDEELAYLSKLDESVQGKTITMRHEPDAGREPGADDF